MIKDKIIYGKIEFCDELNKRFNTSVFVKYTKSPATDYGTGMAMFIQYDNGQEPMYIDMRYEPALTSLKDFEKYVRDFLNNAFKTHTFTVYDCLNVEGK